MSIMSRHWMSCYTIKCPVMEHKLSVLCILSCRMKFHVTSWCDVVLSYVTECRVISIKRWHAVRCELTLCHVVDCYVISFYFLSHHGMSHNTWNTVERLVLSTHVMVSRNILSNLSCYVMLWYIKLHNNTCYYVSLYCFYRMLCRVNACHVMPCYIIRHCHSVLCAEVEGTYVFRHFIRRQTSYSETPFKDLSTHTVTSSKEDFQC